MSDYPEMLVTETGDNLITENYRRLWDSFLADGYEFPAIAVNVPDDGRVIDMTRRH